MKRTRRHWVLLAGSAAAIGCGVALGQGALTEALDATLPDAREIASFNRPGTITLLSSDGQVIQKLGPATREKVNPGEMPLLVKEAFVAAEDRPGRGGDQSSTVRGENTEEEKVCQGLPRPERSGRPQPTPLPFVSHHWCVPLKKPKSQ